MDTFRLDVIADYGPLLLRGAVYTVILTIVVQVVCGAIGLFTALARLSGTRPLVWLTRIYVDFFRGTPLLIQLYWIFFALPLLLNRDVPSAVAAVTALSLHMGAYTSEIIRAGIQSVPRGQMLAARGLGMSFPLALRRIILPPAIRNMTPELISNFVQILKGTALVSVLGFPDLMWQAGQANQFSYRPFEVYSATALIYFALAFPVSMMARRFELRLAAAQRG